LWHPSKMRNPDAVLLSGLSRRQAEAVNLLLSSQGIQGQVAGNRGSGWRVEVDETVHARATAMIADEYPSGLPSFEPKSQPPPRPAVPWFGPGSWMVLSLLVVCVAIHAAVHQGVGPSSRSTMIDAGAILSSAVNNGQVWRLVSAVFLHFDAGHLLSNMITMLFLGPPLARAIGGPRLLFIFVGGGALANVFSHILHPIGGLKAGASGGIAAFLGALGGQALRRRTEKRRTQGWIVIGALAAIYAMMIGFGPGRDNYAHVFGVLSGVLLGWLVPPVATPEESSVPPSVPPSMPPSASSSEPSPETRVPAQPE
jgi:rhomboid protease GluP